MPEDLPAGNPQSVETRAPDAQSDPELLAATREGDTAAYAVLYERHVHAARRLARVLTRDAAGADDLVSETFAKLLHTLRDGRGPDLAFRPYMLRTLRNTFYDRLRRDERVEFTDDLTALEAGGPGGDPTVDSAVEGAERRYAALAFGKLPERWRMVLWHTEVEEDTPAQIASMLGMTANGVAALAYRAREKLRQNYLTEHAADSPPEECRWTVDRLGARVRGKLGARDVGRVDEHLESCVSCSLLFAELTELNSGLRLVLAPVVLGTAAAPYLAAGAASAAGIAAGGVLGFLLSPFVAVGNWCKRVFQQLGPRGSVATGTAGAVVAVAAVVLALLPNGEESEPQAAPDPPAASEPADEEAPGTDEADAPGPAPDDPADPAPEDDPAAPPPEDEADEPAPATGYGIEHGLGTAGLVAGGEGVLPIRLEAGGSGGGYAPASHQTVEAARLPEAGPAPGRPAAWGQAAGTAVSLEITLPEGITLASEDAEPGWRCGGDAARVRCTVPELPDPAVAEVRIAIADHVSGFQSFTVTVSGPGITGTTVLRVPVAPAGSAVAYANVDATGVTAAGNTWLTCALPVCIGDNGPMKPYKATNAAHPQPPAGQEGEAVSGAAVTVPDGARVLWAGLYWAGVDEGLPREVALAGPGGGWTELSAAAVTDTDPGEQAFADVTGLVSGSGPYWLATDNHALPPDKCGYGKGKGVAHCQERQWAGWSLTVVYAERGAESREVAVYDGAPAADTVIDVRGGGEVTLAHTLWGGSAYATGDALTVGGEGMGEPGRGEANGALNNPGWYTYGVDVAVHSAELAENGRIRYERGGDPFIVGVVAVAAPSG
ncbi:MAG TPA: sigma-70 family RNA polymerase sigma factor [Glycomyces sp.]|nr:sigma-70 family RNA polymerase sigma factor [Glycomyces sp.]